MSTNDITNNLKIPLWSHPHHRLSQVLPLQAVIIIIKCIKARPKTKVKTTATR